MDPTVNGGATLGARLDDIGTSAKHAIEEARHLATDVGTTFDIRREVELHPYRSLLIAAGVGYVLGGGLFTPLTRTALRIGLRVAVVPLLNGQIGAMSGQTPT